MDAGDECGTPYGEDKSRSTFISIAENGLDMAGLNVDMDIWFWRLGVTGVVRVGFLEKLGPPRRPERGGVGIKFTGTLLRPGG